MQSPSPAPAVTSRRKWYNKYILLKATITASRKQSALRERFPRRALNAKKLNNANAEVAWPLGKLLATSQLRHSSSKMFNECQTSS